MKRKVSVSHSAQGRRRPGGVCVFTLWPARGGAGSTMNNKNNWIIIVLEIFAAAAIAYINSRFRGNECSRHDDYDHYRD